MNVGALLVCLCFELLDRQSADLESRQLRRHPQRQKRNISSRVDRESWCTKPRRIRMLHDAWHGILTLTMASPALEKRSLLSVDKQRHSTLPLCALTVESSSYVSRDHTFLWSGAFTWYFSPTKQHTSKSPFCVPAYNLESDTKRARIEGWF